MQQEEEFEIKMKDSKGKKKTKSGGFQSMELSKAVFKGIVERGYRVPTPIQRKVIPLALQGKDIVAMARTGSGKTCAFLVPLLERLREHVTSQGVRGLVLSPTRELALQTIRFAKEIGRHTGITYCALVGGESIETQFGLMNSNPDVIIGTPGRILHVVKETSLGLSSVQVLVYDEADRLFELGLSEQINDISKSLGNSPSRQTMLFSATLPSAIVQFAKAGLKDPAVIRLDTETKLSSDLENVFLTLDSASDKEAALTMLISRQLKQNQRNGEQSKLTMVFVATKHHVEYLCSLLGKIGIETAAVYGTMDQTARKIALAKFKLGKVPVLIATDVAARGIDIPLLDAVINYDFPANAKLYVHRAGRVARAGRTGVAISLVSHDELPFMLDLFLFLGIAPKAAQPNEKHDCKNCVYGVIPRSIIDPFSEQLSMALTDSIEIAALKRCTINAMKLYIHTRGLSSADSVRRSKLLPSAAIHPFLIQDKEPENGDGNAEHENADKEKVQKCIVESNEETEEERRKLLLELKSFRPKETALEEDSESKTTPASLAMSEVRSKHAIAIEHFKNASQKRKREEEEQQQQQKEEEEEEGKEEGEGEEKEERLIRKRRKMEERKKQEKFRLSSTPSVSSSKLAYERGLDLNARSGAGVDGGAILNERNALEVGQDEENGMKKVKMIKKWDRRKKKFVTEHGGIDSQSRMKAKAKGVVISESGRKVQAKLPDGTLYKRWLLKTKTKSRSQNYENGNDSDSKGYKSANATGPKKQTQRKPKSELKTMEQVKKQREKEQKEKERRLGEKRGGRGGRGGARGGTGGRGRGRGRGGRGRRN